MDKLELTKFSQYFIRIDIWLLHIFDRKCVCCTKNASTSSSSDDSKKLNQSNRQFWRNMCYNVSYRNHVFLVSSSICGGGTSWRIEKTWTLAHTHILKIWLRQSKPFISNSTHLELPRCAMCLHEHKKITYLIVSARLPLVYELSNSMGDQH